MARNGYRAEDLGLRYEIRLAQLEELHVITIRCFKCNRVGETYPSPLKRRHPDDTRLIDLQPKFRCRSCGYRELNLWNVFRLPPHV